jgi:hypothetical protein
VTEPVPDEATTDPAADAPAPDDQSAPEGEDLNK